MKILGINGSPKREGNTYLALKRLMDAFDKEGFETEIYNLGGRAIKGCTDCRKCQENKDRKCVLNDYVNEAIEKCAAADAIIIGSPVYFSNVTPELKAFIDRVGRVCRANDFLLKNKIGASVAVARRAGTNVVVSDINFFFLINQMIIMGSNYWDGLMGLKPGDIMNDAEGLDMLDTLAENISWLARKLCKN